MDCSFLLIMKTVPCHISLEKLKRNWQDSKEVLQEEKKIRDKKLQAQYVYDRLSQESKELFSNIVKTATKSSYSDVYILQGMNSCSQVVAQLSNILYGDNMINSWVSIDETSENVCIYIKSPLNEIIESNNK